MLYCFSIKKLSSGIFSDKYFLQVRKCDLSHFLRFYIQSIIENKISITGGDIMKKISKTIENYESISKEVKFLPKSMIRLKILECLYESPMNMKSINQKTKFNYSAISNNMHMMELGGYIYQESNNYFLSNSMRIIMGNMLQLGKLMCLLEYISPICQDHIVHVLPIDSIITLHHLYDVDLVESDGLNVYRTYDIIKKSISKSEYVNAILPLSYKQFNNSFNRLLSKKKKVHIMAPADIKEFLIKDLNVSNDNLKIDFMDCDEVSYILLLCTDTKMILGFFKDDENFDQNRLLISTQDECIKWANDLFDHFKKENI